MSLKLVTLKPSKPFFFGKDSVYSNTNYVESEYFPQQTQILGALRAYLLESNQLLKVHQHGKYCAKEVSDKAKKLTGTSNSSSFETNNDLGIINSISPMFIVKTAEQKICDALFKLPANVTKFEVKKDADPCKNDQETSIKIESLKIATPKIIDGALSNNKAVILENYDVKEGFKSALGGKQFWENYSRSIQDDTITEYDKIFKSYEQVGIGLENKKTINGKFYAKRSYMLNKGFELAFLIDIDDKKLDEMKDYHFESGFITMGGDTSTFKMTIYNDMPEAFQEHKVIKALISKEAQEGKTFVLLSDAILEKSIDKEALFQIIPSKLRHRMYKKQNEKKDDSLLRTIRNHKTETKLLVPSGAVYFYETKKQLPQAIGAYEKMGYNKYLAI